MRRATHALRVALAILAGAVFGPLFVALVSLILAVLEDAPRLFDSSPDLGDLAGSLGFIWVIGLIVGGPIGLAAILLLFCPFWWWHHRNGGGPGSFIAAAGLAGLVLGVGLLVFTPGAGEPEGLILAPIFTVASALSGGLMWLIAYAGTRRSGVDPRDLPQANFTAAEPLA